MVNLCLNDIYKFYIYKKRTVCQKAANKKKAYIKHREDIPRSVRPYHVAFVNIDRWTCKPNRNGTCTLSLSLSISFPSLICIFASVQTATAKIITLLIHLTWTKQNSYFENFVIWSIFCAARQLSAIFTIGTIIRCVFVYVILCDQYSPRPHPIANKPICHCILHCMHVQMCSKCRHTRTMTKKTTITSVTLESSWKL